MSQQMDKLAKARQISTIKDVIITSLAILAIGPLIGASIALGVFVFRAIAG